MLTRFTRPWREVRQSVGAEAVRDSHRHFHAVGLGERELEVIPEGGRAARDDIGRAMPNATVSRNVLRLAARKVVRTDALPAALLTAMETCEPGLARSNERSSMRSPWAMAWTLVALV